MSAASPITAAAKALKARHAALLTGEPSFREATTQRKAVEALDAARDRLRDGERPSADQMALDLRGR